jgi:hypothetical protein
MEPFTEAVFRGVAIALAVVAVCIGISGLADTHFEIMSITFAMSALCVLSEIDTEVYRFHLLANRDHHSSVYASILLHLVQTDHPRGFTTTREPDIYLSSQFHLPQGLPVVPGVGIHHSPHWYPLRGVVTISSLALRETSCVYSWSKCPLCSSQLLSLKSCFHQSAGIDCSVDHLVSKAIVHP